MSAYIGRDEPAENSRPCKLAEWDVPSGFIVCSSDMLSTGGFAATFEASVLSNKFLWTPST